jgi:hypothetical protein
MYFSTNVSLNCSNFSIIRSIYCDSSTIDCAIVFHQHTSDITPEIESTLHPNSPWVNYWLNFNLLPSESTFQSFGWIICRIQWDRPSICDIQTSKTPTRRIHLWDIPHITKRRWLCPPSRLSWNERSKWVDLWGARIAALIDQKKSFHFCQLPSLRIHIGYGPLFLAVCNSAVTAQLGGHPSISRHTSTQ